MWVTRVSLECLGPEERTGLRDLRVDPAPTVRLDQSARQERRANLVSQGYQAIPEDRALRALMVSLVSLDQTERKEDGASLANLVQEVNVDRRAPVVVVEPEAQQESQELREHQAMMDLQVDLAREDLKGLRGQSASLDLKAPMDHLGKTDCPATLDREERLVSKGRLAPRDQEGS